MSSSTRAPCAGTTAATRVPTGSESAFCFGTSAITSTRSQEAVLDALRTGRFYGSTGPEIHHVEQDADAVVVRCSPAASVTLRGSRYRGARASAGRLGYPNATQILERDPNGLITACRLEKPVLAPYGRLEIADTAGRRAWTNAPWTA